MNDLNLLPKIPRTVKYFIPLLSLILLLFVSACVVLWSWSDRVQRIRSERAAEYKLEAAKLQTLENKTRIKTEDQNLNKLIGEFAKLNAERRDWTPVLVAIASELPAGARLKTAAAESDTLKLTVQFLTLEEAGQYELRLANNPLFQKAALTVIEAKAVVAGANAGIYEEQLEVKLAPIQK